MLSTRNSHAVLLLLRIRHLQYKLMLMMCIHAPQAVHKQPPLRQLEATAQGWNTTAAARVTSAAVRTAHSILQKLVKTKCNRPACPNSMKERSLLMLPRLLQRRSCCWCCCCCFCLAASCLTSQPVLASWSQLPKLALHCVQPQTPPEHDASATWAKLHPASHFPQWLLLVSRFTCK
jgi:hypothetical protein